MATNTSLNVLPIQREQDLKKSERKESLKIDTTKTQIELLPLNDFSALSGAAELIFKGWDKEAIPFSQRKKSIISSFFERFF